MLVGSFITEKIKFINSLEAIMESKILTRNFVGFSTLNKFKRFFSVSALLKVYI